MSLSSRVLIEKGFCQVSLFPPPCPSHSAVTSWAPGCSLFCSASHPALPCFLCKPEAIQLWPSSCGAAFPCRDAAGSLLPGDALCPVALPGCVTLRGPARLSRALRGCAADGTVVFPMSYCRGLACSAPARVSGDGAGTAPGSGSLGKPSTPGWALCHLQSSVLGHCSPRRSRVCVE